MTMTAPPEQREVFLAALEHGVSPLVPGPILRPAEWDEATR